VFGSFKDEAVAIEKCYSLSMVMVQERESKPVATEEQALREVEGYIERVEKQTEIKKPSGPLQSSSVTVPPQVQDDAGNVVMQAAQQQKEIKIVLPMDEEDIKKGLHHKVFDAVRWLAEWCVMMIKKYPGKVFYPDQGSRIHNKQ
jgi:hypothetical protein